jgi:hypothetical protein
VKGALFEVAYPEEDWKAERRCDAPPVLLRCASMESGGHLHASSACGISVLCNLSLKIKHNHRREFPVVTFPIHCQLSTVAEVG